jgi:hypothetical protein
MYEHKTPKHIFDVHVRFCVNIISKNILRNLFLSYQLDRTDSEFGCMISYVKTTYRYKLVNKAFAKSG